MGEAENPITIKIGATVVKAYDGTNAQPAGDYFRIVDLNQGIFQLVNQLGAPKAGATGVKISYSQATNIVLFNLDVASGNTLEKHLNGLLREVGAAKASMSGQRYEHVDYLLMSPVLNDTISNAEQFVVSLKRNGSDTTGGGDLMKIKDIPAYSTNAPHTDMGDGRIIMGVRGNTSYTVAKPFSTGDLFEITNAQGQPLGKKVAYGEEYNAIHTPRRYFHYHGKRGRRSVFRAGGYLLPAECAGLGRYQLEQLGSEVDGGLLPLSGARPHRPALPAPQVGERRYQYRPGAEICNPADDQRRNHCAGA